MPLQHSEASGVADIVFSCTPFSSSRTIPLAEQTAPRIADIVQVTGVTSDQTMHSSSSLVLAEMMRAKYLLDVYDDRKLVPPPCETFWSPLLYWNSSSSKML